MVAKYVNIAGLCLDIVGAVIIWGYTPAQRSQLFIYQKEEYIEMAKKDKRNELRINRGMIALGTGFVLQLIATLMEP
jgi:hypothetical protein